MVTINNKMVNAKDLHQQLEAKKHFATWIKERIEQADLIEGKDFYPIVGKSTGGRPSIDYNLSIEAAKEICLLQQTPKGKEIRRKLIDLSQQVEEQKLLSIEKTVVLVQMLNIFKYEETQMEAEDLHKKRFKLTHKTRENIHKAFYKHRNELLSIDNNELKQGLIEAFNKGLIHKVTAKNIRSRIALLDRYVLLRNAVADYLISTGLNPQDAINFADTVKIVAEQTQVEIRIKDEDNLFQTKENISINQLKLTQ